MTEQTEGDVVLAHIVAAGRLVLDERGDEAADLIRGLALHSKTEAFSFLRGIVRVLAAVHPTNLRGVLAAREIEGDPAAAEGLAILRAEVDGDQPGSQLQAYLLTESIGADPAAFVDTSLFLLAGVATFVQAGRLHWPDVGAVVVTTQHPERN